MGMYSIQVEDSSPLKVGQHCVKSVRIRIYSGLQFPTFGLNTERYFSRSVDYKIIFNPAEGEEPD